MAERPYHKFVFDAARRRFVGRFESMYRDEDRRGYDSWFQDDLTHLGKRLALAILDQYRFDSVLDLGCGKGAFTHLLKKRNNRVVGADLSRTAVEKARARFPDIEFRNATALRALTGGPRWDLVVTMELLSYVQDWAKLIERVSRRTKRYFLSLYLPPDPIGFVKSFDDLRAVFRKRFETEAEVLWNRETLLLLGRSR